MTATDLERPLWGRDHGAGIPHPIPDLRPRSMVALAIATFLIGGLIPTYDR